MKSNRLRSGPERLESRRLLAQTPQLLFDVRFDLTFSEGDNSLSPIYELNDTFVARATRAIDIDANLEVFNQTDGERASLEGFRSNA